ncbi:MAG: GvpL/GvpF family gas vesicle protein [Bacteroidota bacterium]
MSSKGIYIYGIVPNFYGAPHFQSLENSGVYAISYQKISAIVSDRETAYLDFLDRESLAHILVHHQKTIEDIMAKGFSMILPMKLGTIVQSKEEVLNILATGHDLMISTLKKIEYLTEIDLAVTWADFPGAIKEIAGNPDIIRLKDQLLQSGVALTQVDQVKIGMLLKEKLVEKNKAAELKILEAFSTISLDIKIHDVMNDEMITNSAALINRNNTDQFERAIEKLDEQYNGALNFKIVGPLPCYSFFTIEVKELNAETVENARKDLGLAEETSENEIKKAYLAKAGLMHPDKSQNNQGGDDFNRIKNAYQTLLEYSLAVRQGSNDNIIFLSEEKVVKNLILVKIKE